MNQVHTHTHERGRTREEFLRKILIAILFISTKYAIILSSRLLHCLRGTHTHTQAYAWSQA